MAPSTPLLTHESVAEFWRRRFRRQKHINAGVHSLLRKYGSATTGQEVVNELLLSLMGNLITSEACYYRMSRDERSLIPSVALGATPLDSLPPIDTDSGFVRTALESGSPRLVNSLPRTATDDMPLSTINDHFKVFAPLHYEERLLGIVFLGEKVSGASFTDNDLELLEALSAVTAAVLIHKESQRLTGTSEAQSTRLLARCQELAGGVANHLEQSLAAIDRVITTDKTAHGNENLTTSLAERVASMRYLVSSLRVLANEPATLESSLGERYDIVAALQEAVFSFDSDIASRSYTLTLRHEIQPMEDVTAVDRTTVVDATSTTLRSAIEQYPNASQLDVHIDRADGLPAGIGDAPANESPGVQPDSRIAHPMLRVRIEAHDCATARNSAGGQMKILADNLEAFQSLRDTAPSQQLIVEHGGAIFCRREPGLAVWLVYLPLSFR